MIGVVLFGVPHLMVLAVTALVVVCYCVAAGNGEAGGKVRVAGPKLRAAEYFLAAAMCLTFPVQVVVASRYGTLTLGNYFPLHLCDVAAYVGALALVTRRRLPSELIYFWGIGATLQALVTPVVLENGFPHPTFFTFFAHHGCVVIAAIYVVAGRRDFPRPGALWRAILWAHVYLGLAGLANVLLGTNYAFLCSKPNGAGSLFDLLGPWPWYLMWLEVVGILTFALLYLPFYFWNRRRRRSR